MDKSDQLADILVAALGVRIERALAPLVSRLEACERRGMTPADVTALVEEAVAKAPIGKQGEPGPVGPVGPAGEPTHIDTVRVMVLDEIGKAVGILPRAQDGKSVTIEEVRPLIQMMVDSIPRPVDGINGKDADPEVVRSMVLSEVERAVEAIPRPKDGADGRDGVDGKDGINGRDGIDGKDGAPGEKGMDGINGRDGVDGKDGERGMDGAVGEKGMDGANGRDGIDGEKGMDGAPGESIHPDTVRMMVQEAVTKSIADMPPAQPGKDADPMVLAASVHEEVQRQFDAIREHIKGAPGEPGDGLQDMTMDLKEDGRTLVFQFIGKSFQKEIEVIAPWQIYRGVWKSGRYQKGDVVTYAGSSWVALADTEETPGKSSDWQLAVKKGKDA
jgi:hypothetical protein